MPEVGITRKMTKRSILKTLAGSLLLLTLLCLITVSTDVKAECSTCKWDYVVFREPAFAYEENPYYYYFNYPYCTYCDYYDYVYDFVYNPYYYYSFYNPYYVVLDDYLNWFEVNYPVYYSTYYDSLLDFYYNRVCSYDAFDWRYYWNDRLLYWTPYLSIYAPRTPKTNVKVDEPKNVVVPETKSDLAAVKGNISISANVPDSLNAEAQIILYTNTNNEITGTVLFRNKSTGEYVSFQDQVNVVASGFGAGQAQISVGRGMYQVLAYQQNQNGNLHFIVNSGATFRVVK